MIRGEKKIMGLAGVMVGATMAMALAFWAAIIAGVAIALRWVIYGTLPFVLALSVATAALGQDMHFGTTLVAQAERMTEERCADLLARYTRKCTPSPKPPTPDPTQSPSPTRTPPPPIPCEPIGGTKTYADGEEKMLCFTVAQPPTPRPGGFPISLVQVQSRNHGNASCAHLLMTCTSPTGEVAHSQGVQPGCSFRFAAGKFYVWTKLLRADPAVCRSYTFTVAP